MSLEMLEPRQRHAPEPHTQNGAGAPDDDGGGKEIRAGLFTIALFFFGFGGWAAFAPLDAAVVAPGVVMVSGNRQTVQHREGGIISQLLVEEGDRVSRGQVLIELG